VEAGEGGAVPKAKCDVRDVFPVPESPQTTTFSSTTIRRKWEAGLKMRFCQIVMKPKMTCFCVFQLVNFFTGLPLILTAE